MSAISNPQTEASIQPSGFAAVLPHRTHSLAAHVGLAVAMGIACVLRLHCLYFRYLFLDECGTIWAIAGGSYKEMLDRALHWTASGPLFVLCYRLSCDLVGNIVLGVKLPGILCGTLEVWAVWWSARKLFEREDVAQLAAWFVAIAPFFVAYSQDARPYMPAALLVTLSIGFLASWLRRGRRLELAGTVLFAVLAVGFHLVAALLLVAHNLVVIQHGVVNRWARRRRVEWLLAQLVAACALWLIGIQFRILTGRHNSLIFETGLPMPTRQLLDLGMTYELYTDIGVVLIALAIGLIARKFPSGWVAKACSTDRSAICTAVSCYVVPAFLISLLSALRVVDCWPRYYFLFQPGLMIALAWVVIRPLPRLPAGGLATAIGVVMLCQYQSVGGIPTCRLNTNWQDSVDAELHLRRVIGPNDLVISRAGFIEANQVHFLSDSVGVSYLKCFLEATAGPLPGEHIPLPFSIESESTAGYLERLICERLSNRSDFWLVNVQPNDFDYCAWLDQRLRGRFRKNEEYNYSAYVLCRYVRNPETDLAENR